MVSSLDLNLRKKFKMPTISPKKSFPISFCDRTVSVKIFSDLRKIKFYYES